MLRKTFVLPILAVMVLALINCGDATPSAEQAATKAAGSPAGAVTMLADYDLGQTAGKVVFVELWGVWCPPCIRSMPHVEETWKHYQSNDDFQMMVVNTGWRGDTPDKVKNWLKSNGKYTFPVFFDNRPQPQQFATQNKVNSIPRSIILNKKGEVAYNGHPMQIPEGLIDKLLAES